MCRIAGTHRAIRSVMSLLLRLQVRIADAAAAQRVGIERFPEEEPPDIDARENAVVRAPAQRGQRRCAAQVADGVGDDGSGVEGEGAGQRAEGEITQHQAVGAVGPARDLVDRPLGEPFLYIALPPAEIEAGCDQGRHGDGDHQRRSSEFQAGRHFPRYSGRFGSRRRAKCGSSPDRGSTPVQLRRGQAVHIVRRNGAAALQSSPPFRGSSGSKDGNAAGANFALVATWVAIAEHTIRRLRHASRDDATDDRRPGGESARRL